MRAGQAAPLAGPIVGGRVMVASWRQMVTRMRAEPPKANHKGATFTVLAEDPYDVDAADLHKIEVIGTLHEGGWFSAAEANFGAVAVAIFPAATTGQAWGPPTGNVDHAGRSCEAARALAWVYRDLYRAA